MCLFTVDELCSQVLWLRNAAHFNHDPIVLISSPDGQSNKLQNAIHQVSARSAAGTAIFELHGICHIDSLILLVHFRSSLPVLPQGKTGEGIVSVCAQFFFASAGEEITHLINFASMLTSATSLTTTPTRFPSLFSKMCFRVVVLPTPRNPEMNVIGTCHHDDSEAK
jgi:hypothetical protein